MRLKILFPALLALLQVACIFGKKDDDDSDVDVVGDDDDVPSLTSSEFEDAYGDRFCDEMASCDPSEPCNPAEWSNTLDTSCDFDPVQGQGCLDGTWTCDDSHPDHPFVEYPNACYTVYDC